MVSPFFLEIQFLQFFIFYQNKRKVNADLNCNKKAQIANIKIQMSNE